MTNSQFKETAPGTVTPSCPYRIDEEFATFLPVAPAENDRELEESILRHGRCLTPLRVWKEKQILFDGHRRDRAIRKLREAGHKIADPQIDYTSFSSRAEVKWEMLRNQDTHRPNWNSYEKNKRILEDPDLREIDDKAKKRMIAGKAANPALSKKQGRAPDSLAIKADKAGTSRSSMYETSQILRRPELRKKVDAGLLTPRDAVKAIQADKLRRQDDRSASHAGRYFPRLERDDGSVINEIIPVDVLKGLRLIPAKSVALVMFSPPYPILGMDYGGWKYDGDYPKYLRWMGKVFAASRRVLRDGGRIVVNFDQTYCPEDPTEFRRNLYADFSRLLNKAGFKYRDDALWYKQNCVGYRPHVGSVRNPSAPRIQRNWEYVSIWGKGMKSLKPTRTDVPAKKLIDITRDEFFKWATGHWDIKPVKRRESRHRAAYPEELVKRIIKMFTFRGDVVCDPFVGSGTTCAVAARYGRQWIGIDNHAPYVKRARRRVAAARKQAELDAQKSVRQLRHEKRQYEIAAADRAVANAKSSLRWAQKRLHEVQRKSRPLRNLTPRLYARDLARR